MNVMVKWFSMSALLVLSLFAFQANAACIVSAQIVERVLSYDGNTYVYFRPKGALTNSFYYYMRTTSDQIASTAANAQTDRTEVNAYGQATSCPTSGTARYMGDALYIYMIN